MVQPSTLNGNTKRVKLFNDEISVEVPSSWIQKDHYSKYTDYETVCDVRLSSVDSSSLLTVNVCDIKYCKKISITNDLLAVERQSDS